MNIRMIVLMAVLACGGCASINEAWMKAYVAVHDAADAALSNKPPAVVSALTNAAPVAKPEPVGVIKYTAGSKTQDEGGEIWLTNWNRMNIRVHVNPGEFRALGIKSAGPWYPMDMAKAPAGAVTLTKTESGCTITAKDFVSTSGQRYHVEGFRADGIGQFTAGNTLTLTQAQMHGAVFVWLASVE
jgi:hypothetical protein